MSYTAECLEKFRELPSKIRDFYNSWDSLRVISSLEKKYSVKLSFLIILLAIGELYPEDIEDYLIQKFRITDEDADDISEELISKIIDPVFEKMLTFSGDKFNGKETNLENNNFSKNLVLQVFSHSLVEHLSADNDDLKKLNIVIFQAFNQTENLEEKVITALYANQEKLTQKKIMIDGQEAYPTVSNWLKDFIKTNGSAMFNEIVLAEYLTSSENVKKLNIEEKNLVNKLLKLYKNLVFFPDNTENMPLEKWGIFPLDDDQNIAKSEKNKKSDLPIIIKKIENSKKIVASKITEIPTPSEPVSAEEEMIDELQLSLKKYSEASLEYKAIIQEIKRLRKKNLKI